MELNLCMGCMCEKKQEGPCPVCGFDEATYEPAPHHLHPGTILYGKYVVGRVLGEGGFGITYVGWDINLELKVAIKEYYPNGFVARENSRGNTVTSLTGYRSEFFAKGLDKFVDEARRLAKFWRLPGIVAVKDYFQENKTAYIVMEFAEGQTLKNLLKQTPEGRLPVDKAFDMIQPVMESLETVHEAGLIHRDISPDNLMVDSKGGVKLLDFGAARDFLAEGERSMSVMLKPGYAPQEQYSSKGKQGPWTDIYGLCATIYRAITGEVPLEALDRMDEDELKRPSELGIDMPRPLEDALMKGLAVRPKDRFQSVGELRAAMLIPEEKYADKDSNEGKDDTDDHCSEVKADGSNVGNEDVSLVENVDQDGFDDREDARKADAYIENNDVSNSMYEVPESNVVPEKKENIKKYSGRKNVRLLALCCSCVAFIVILAVVYSMLEHGDNSTVNYSGANGKSQAEPNTLTEAEKDTAGVKDTDTLTTDDYNADEVVIWKDPNMERLIREGLGRPTEDITVGDLAEIQVIRINGNYVKVFSNIDEDKGIYLSYDAKALKSEEIQSVEDLRWCTNIKRLAIVQHDLQDIRVLEKLVNLQTLSLSYNSISDISALEKLVNLQTLSLSYNSISDISALGKLVNLQKLYLGSNNISDIRTLENLVDLQELYLGSNNISDISALENLENIQYLNLYGNPITNASMLDTENMEEYTAP